MACRIETLAGQSRTGSQYLLNSNFRTALDTYAMKFRLHSGDDDFLGGKYEGDTVRTVPLNKRRGQVAGDGEVIVWTTFLLSSLVSIPVRYLYRVPPGPGDAAVIIGNNHFGEIVDIENQVYPGNQLCGRTRGPERQWLVLSSLDMVAVYKL